MKHSQPNLPGSNNPFSLWAKTCAPEPGFSIPNKINRHYFLHVSSLGRGVSSPALLPKICLQAFGRYGHSDMLFVASLSPGSVRCRNKKPFTGNYQGGDRFHLVSISASMPNLNMPSIIVQIKPRSPVTGRGSLIGGQHGSLA